MMTAKQFVCYFVSACLFLLILVAVFNRIIDPFWYYRDTEITGLNAIKTKFRRYERDVKPALLVREQPDALILGSSYAEIGFNPMNSDFTQQGQLSSMNFALAGAPWSMVMCEFAFAVTHSHPKRVLIGIHPENMPKTDCAKEFPNIGNITVSELLLSDRTFIASVQTIIEQKKAQPSHTKQGMYFYTRDITGIERRFKEDFIQRFTPINPLCLQTSQFNGDPSFPIAEARLDLTGLQYLINLAHQHQVELTLFIYPRHAYVLELEHQCGTQFIRWQVMKQIARLNEQQTAQPVTIWLFDGYNAVTTEAIGAKTIYWQDPAHFNFELGDLLLADMFHEPSNPKLGKKMRFDTLDADYQQLLQQRSTYLQEHPEFQTNLQKLIHSITP